MANKKTVMGLIAILEETYQLKEKLTKGTAKLWVDLFSDIPDKLLSLSTKQHIAVSKWFPKPSELLDVCRQLGNFGNEAPPAIIAWGEVQSILKNGNKCNEWKELRKTIDTSKDEYAVAFESIEHNKKCDICSGKSGPVFSHPVITQTVEALGWDYLRMSITQMADRAHFLKAYDQLKNRQEDNDKLLPEIKELAESMRVKKLPGQSLRIVADKLGGGP